ncbi:hypothetical protein AGLY_008257 [Aphis glycines]|uniref:Uncharacterized protein n=1 Tax=Aphis glycines TaxID=307491 RepID=A0A6G0TLB7_APHGL|nr:hypothetical protein AGLY_008257 [Aphis glycines]
MIYKDTNRDKESLYSVIESTNSLTIKNINKLIVSLVECKVDIYPPWLGVNSKEKNQYIFIVFGKLSRETSIFYKTAARKNKEKVKLFRNRLRIILYCKYVASKGQTSSMSEKPPRTQYTEERRIYIPSIPIKSYKLILQRGRLRGNNPKLNLWVVWPAISNTILCTPNHPNRFHKTFRSENPTQLISSKNMIINKPIIIDTKFLCLYFNDLNIPKLNNVPTENANLNNWSRLMENLDSPCIKFSSIFENPTFFYRHFKLTQKNLKYSYNTKTLLPYIKKLSHHRHRYGCFGVCGIRFFPKLCNRFQFPVAPFVVNIAVPLPYGFELIMSNASSKVSAVKHTKTALTCKFSARLFNSGSQFLASPTNTAVLNAIHRCPAAPNAAPTNEHYDTMIFCTHITLYSFAIFRTSVFAPTNEIALISGASQIKFTVSTLP